ncbi:MAG: nucleotide exchange factor GrpE [Dysgonamonadaceae bacterium]|jgi:molecular chaperone GrpE|nr:nucleotide exchange factor GrpE [Dysgonamonadaceae bacterium]
MKDKDLNEKDLEQLTENETLSDDNSAEELPNESSEETPTEEAAGTTDNLADELAQMKDSYLRLMAEYDNYRKRTIKEKADLIKNGGEKILVGLLPVVDDFGRALENIDKATDLSAVKEGVDLIYQKFLSFLQQNGVKTIESTGQTFDADLHEAVAMIPAASDEQKDTVIDTVQTGYTLNDKVIRHAKVVVATNN